MDEKKAAIEAVGKIPTQTFRLTCEVTIAADGKVDAQIAYDIKRSLIDTTWDRLGVKCFAACKTVVSEHFDGEREKDVA